MRVAGLDLAAKSTNCSGYALIDVSSLVLVKLTCLYSDEQIVSTILSDGVALVSVDSPISREPVFRAVDREAIQRGFRVLPPNLGPMRNLTLRGWRLYEKLSSEGITVIETHPSSALKSSGCRNPLDLAKILGIDVEEHLQGYLGKDLRDALVAALVALCYVRGDCLQAIEADDGRIYLIKLSP